MEAKELRPILVLIRGGKYIMWEARQESGRIKSVKFFKDVFQKSARRENSGLKKLQLVQTCHGEL